MRIQHIDHNELASLASRSRRPWLEAACSQLLVLPGHPRSRILAVVDGEWTSAILGLELIWENDGRLKCVTIRVLAVDPDHGGCGVGARLIRFAEDLAHINGCKRLCAAPGLEQWNGGRSRLTTGRYDLGRRSSRDNQRCCA